MKPLVIAAALASAGASAASPALAQGGCVGKVLLPPVETARSERVLEAPGHVERTWLPAQVEHMSRRVLVRAGGEERMRWAAEYRIERSYVSIPGRVRWTREPDRYADVTERALVAPGHFVWQRRYGPTVSGPPRPGQTIVTPTGVVMC